MRGVVATVLVFSAFIPASVSWGTVIAEGAGDFSNNGLAPSGPFVLTVGSNPVSGNYGAVSGVVDRDYLTIVVPVGQRLDRIVVGSGFRAGGGGLSFIGIEAGPQVLASPTSGGPSLLGFALVGAADIGTNILGQFQLVSPLTAGTYSVWIQETGQGVFPYAYDLQVAVIPEPGIAMAVVAAGGTLLIRRRK